jgi:glyoxylase-like metal-dependent hydrolase (beta-lactamase superfamily II)
MEAVMWEAYALAYAENTGRRRRNHFLPPDDAHDTPHPITYYVWAARHAGTGAVVVFDTGFPARRAPLHGHRYLRSPAEALALIGIEARGVTDVVLTHLHYDHAGGYDAFPAARFHLQDAEMAYATGRCMCHPHLRRPFMAEDVSGLVHHVFAGRVVFHEGDAEPWPGIRLLAIGGHSAGLMAARIETATGPVVLASDAAHFDETLTGNPFPIVLDMRAVLEGHRRLLAEAGGDARRVVPGHDPAVLARFPPAAPGLKGIAVRLDQAR